MPTIAPYAPPAGFTPTKVAKTDAVENQAADTTKRAHSSHKPAESDRVTINPKARRLEGISNFVNNFDRSKSLDDMAAGLMKNAGITDKNAIKQLADDMKTGRVKDAEGIADSISAYKKANRGTNAMGGSNVNQLQIQIGDSNKAQQPSSMSLQMFGMTVDIQIGGFGGGFMPSGPSESGFSFAASPKSNSPSFSSNVVREKMDRLATEGFINRFANSEADAAAKAKQNADNPVAKNSPINQFLAVADL